MASFHVNIEYDRHKFHPGQVVSGRVILRMDKPIEVRAVEFILKGKVKCEWTSRESQKNSEGKTEWRDNKKVGMETLFENKMNLAGKGRAFVLSIGEYVYPFSLTLPTTLPCTYRGTYGGVSYCGKVKLDALWSREKSQKRNFIVESLLNLNDFPDLNRHYVNEKSKTFCCLCCASGPLTITLEMPRTAYAFNEAIPLTIDVENASTVNVNAITIELYQKIQWKTNRDSKVEKVKLKTQRLQGGVENKKSKAWNEEFSLGPNQYPNINCRFLSIDYELKIELNVNGPHFNLKMKTPIAIGDIPYCYGDQATNQCPWPQPSSADIGLGMPSAPPSAPNSPPYPNAAAYPNSAPYPISPPYPNDGYNPGPNTGRF